MSKKDFRYAAAKVRNMEACLSDCQMSLKTFLYGLDPCSSNILPLEQYSLDRFKARLGFRNEDKSEDTLLTNLAAAKFATACTMINRHVHHGLNKPIGDQDVAWLNLEPFASMDGGQRMNWVRFAKCGWIFIHSGGNTLSITCRVPNA